MILILSNKGRLNNPGKNQTCEYLKILSGIMAVTAGQSHDKRKNPYCR